MSTHHPSPKLINALDKLTPIAIVAYLAHRGHRELQSRNYDTIIAVNNITRHLNHLKEKAVHE